MELSFRFFWRNHLLFLFVLLNMQLPHVQSVRIGVRNIFHNGSNHLPKDCDQVCASRLRMERLFGGGGNKTSSMGSMRGRMLQDDPQMLQDPSKKVELIRNTDFWENYIQVNIGGQWLDLAVATTWDFIVLQCDCSNRYDCLNPKAPFYDTTRSTALRYVAKEEQFCKNFEQAGYGMNTEEHCGFRINNRQPFWSKGYAMTGNVDVWVEEERKRYTLKNLNVGCSLRGSFNKESVKSGLLVSGVAGFYKGGNGLSLPEQRPGVRSYSICVPSENAPDSGFLILNDNDLIDNPEYVTCVLQPPQHVAIYGMKVGDLTANLPAGARIYATFDSGSPYTRLIETWYTPFRDAWVEMLRELGMGEPYPHPDVPEMELCYVYPQGIQLPTATLLLRPRDPVSEFQLSGNVIEFWPDGAEGARHMCLPLVRMQEEGGHIVGSAFIGAIHMEKTQIRIQYNQRRLGWRHNAC